MRISREERRRRQKEQAAVAAANMAKEEAVWKARRERERAWKRETTRRLVGGFSFGFAFAWGVAVAGLLASPLIFVLAVILRALGL